MKYNLKVRDGMPCLWRYIQPMLFLKKGFYTQEHLIYCVGYHSKCPINTWADVEKYAQQNDYDITNDDNTGVTT